ncbi:cysteinyl-tRNA synthetase [Bifidobacterium commune]|uniref:Cysteine--tRNA ligase n=2 Tax=Bifidobacterium commune TaxID=1505727 RepID=A0A1C4H7L0_9BIFI|nr:cysteinyl-tRNA synthetase [Bifidobacterium commune]SCC80703.1 cysteinyl-tRNA synthetase [Bifidobacterium commune]
MSVSTANAIRPSLSAKAHILEAMENAKKPQDSNLSESALQPVLAQAATGLKLYDTATHETSPFTPIVPGKAGIYVCGATVQSSPHIGHIRAAVAFDVVRRWLVKLGYDVTFIRNVTDIDDKILDKAATAGQQWWARAYHYEREFSHAYDTLGVLPPTYEPRATGHIGDMIDLIERLIERGHAYVITDKDGKPTGNVFFDVSSWPHYGELTHQKPSQQNDSAAEVADKMGPSIDQSGDDKYNPADPADYLPDKRSPRDFALWKAPKESDPETARWSTPFGTGRPGWHIECSAMSHRYLDSMFDIHGGGLDLRFPHHENEMAQTRAAGYESANIWMHSAWVTAKGEKMSKSLGNGLSVPSVLAQNSAWVVRYALGGVQYRSMLEWSDQTLTEAQSAYERISHFIANAGEMLGPGEQPSRDEVLAVTADDLPSDFTDAMNDDINVSGATAAIFTTIRQGNSLIAGLESAQANAEVNPFDEAEMAALTNEYRNTLNEANDRYADISRKAVQEDAKARFALTHSNVPADVIDMLTARVNLHELLLSTRAMLDTLGLDPLAKPWNSEDTEGTGKSTKGSVDTEAEHRLLDSMIQHQLEARNAARKAKNFEVADKIRDSLSEMGVTIEDKPSGSTWSLR